MKRITVLGSTGSIGTNTLDVLSRHPDRFSVYALTAARQVDLLFEQCVRFKPEWAVMTDPNAALSLEQRLTAAGCRTRVAAGAAAHGRVHGTSIIDRLRLVKLAVGFGTEAVTNAMPHHIHRSIPRPC